MEKNNFIGLEKREFARLKDNIFIFGNLRSNPTEKFKAFTRDISGGGLMFETERNISKEKEKNLELEIYLPMDRYRRMIFSVPVLAKMIWIRKIEKGDFEEGENKYRVGVEFSEIKEENRHRIIKYVEENKS